MKKMILGLSLFFSFSSQAGQMPVFKCQVPAKTPTVTIEIAVSDSESVDYVSVDINDKETTNLFIQMEKGQFKALAKTGNISAMVLGNAIQQGEDGVIRDAGLLSLGQEAGKWTGLLTVSNNIYPLECTKL